MVGLFGNTDRVYNVVHEYFVTPEQFTTLEQRVESLEERVDVLEEFTSPIIESNQNQLEELRIK